MNKENEREGREKLTDNNAGQFHTNDHDIQRLNLTLSQCQTPKQRLKMLTGQSKLFLQLL